MKLKTLSTVIILSTFGLYQCNFDTLENERIIGNYWIRTIDLPENRMLGYTKGDDGSYQEIIVPNTIVKLEWNKDYFLVSRNPSEDVRGAYLEVISSTIREREIEKLDLAPNNDLIFDPVLNDRIDSLANNELNQRIKTDLNFLNKPNRSDLIIWYLFKNNGKYPAKIFLTKESLESYIDSLGIKSFKNTKTYK